MTRVQEVKTVFVQMAHVLNSNVYFIFMLAI